MDLEVLSGAILVVGALLILYRLLVAGVFIWLARRLKGPVNLTGSDLLWVGLASLFDTVLGLFAIAILAVTRTGNVDAAKRIIARTSGDLEEAAEILSGVENVKVKNIVRDLRLMSSKLKALTEEPAIGSPKAIELLETIQSAAFSLRDKADDLSLEEDPARIEALASLMEKKLERGKKTLSELIELLT